ERLRETVTDGAGLAGETTTDNRCADVVLVHALGGDERLLQDHLQDGAREVGRDVPVIDGDLAVSAAHPHARDRVLALAGGVRATLRVELLDMDRRGRLGRLTGEIAE